MNVLSNDIKEILFSQKFNDSISNFVVLLFSLKKISRVLTKQYFDSLFRYDVGKDGFLDLAELKFMMEKLQAPQTHLGLKAMIAEVDEDKDGKISFREFLLIYR